MNKSELIQARLIEIGVRKHLTKPYPLLISKLLKADWKPRLFEKPIKLFFLQFLYGATIWGGFMWLVLWQFQEPSIKQLYATIFFGILTGLFFAFELLQARRKFGITSWDKWLKDNNLN